MLLTPSMGQDRKNQAAWDVARAARAQRIERQFNPLRRAVRGIRSFLSNRLSITLLRIAHQRAAPIRLFIGFFVTIVWLILGGGAALDYGRATFANPNAEVPTANIATGSVTERAILAVSSGVCIFRDGKPCDYRKYETRIVAGQTALTILALITLFFGFWKQLFASAAKAIRYMGARHVIVTGDGPEALSLAVDAAAKRNRNRRATILIRKSASEAEIESMGAEGVTLLVGNAADKGVLAAAGARSAYRIVALSQSDAENVAAAASFSEMEGFEPGDVAVRLESFDLRRDLPTHGEFGASDTFSLAEISARLFTQTAPLLEDVKLHDGAAGVHVAILGWDDVALACAERILRMMWFPGLAAPRVTVFTPDAAGAQREFQARFPQAMNKAVAVWSADIDFVAYDWKSEHWTPIDSIAQSRGPVTSLIVSYPSDQETLHCAAVLAGRINPQRPSLYVRDDENGTTSAVLRAYRDKRVLPFAQRKDVLSANALVDRRLDTAARRVHDTYIESCIFRQNTQDYLNALSKGSSFSTCIGRILKPAPKDLPADPEARIAALEIDFKERLGPDAYATLRARLAEKLMIAGLYTPSPDNPAQRIWDQLNEHYVETNRAAADHAVLKLQALGWRPAQPGEKGERPIIAAADISDDLASVEHMRWCADKIMGGWRLGPRNDVALTHPDLKPYADFAADELPAAIAKDRDNWISAPMVARWTYPQGFVRDA